MQPECNVCGDVQVGEQRVILEDHADAAVLRRHAEVHRADELAVQADFAARHRLESGDAAQNGGLAAAAGAEQACQFTALQREREAGKHAIRAVKLRDGIERNDVVRSGSRLEAVAGHVRAL